MRNVFYSLQVCTAEELAVMTRGHCMFPCPDDTCDNKKCCIRKRRKTVSDYPDTNVGGAYKEQNSEKGSTNKEDILYTLTGAHIGDLTINIENRNNCNHGNIHLLQQSADTGNIEGLQIDIDNEKDFKDELLYQLVPSNRL